MEIVNTKYIFILWMKLPPDWTSRAPLCNHVTHWHQSYHHTRSYPATWRHWNIEPGCRHRRQLTTNGNFVKCYLEWFSFFTYLKFFQRQLKTQSSERLTDSRSFPLLHPPFVLWCGRWNYDMKKVFDQGVIKFRALRPLDRGKRYYTRKNTPVRILCCFFFLFFCWTPARRNLS